MVSKLLNKDKNERIAIKDALDHPWFVGVQFHPEFTSSPRDGHPLFTSYVEAARVQREKA